MIDIMLQENENDFIIREVVVQNYYFRFMKQFFRKSIRHELLFLNNQHEWNKFIVDDIYHLNHDERVSDFETDDIKAFDVFRH